MDLITIVQSLFRWGVPALIGGLAILFVGFCAYWMYKKVFHGKKAVTPGQAICAGLLCCWLLLVLGLTAMSRGANFTGSVNVDFLSGYVSAWNNWSISELQLILFNMLMFSPLGFLLPLLWKKAENLWVTAAVSLCLTGSIEVLQLLTGTGIFELDDLLHNLLGSLFGYFCIMAILAALREKTLRPGPIAKALLIPGAIGLILGGVVYAYHRQPYGNMSVLPAVKQDLSRIQIVNQGELSAQNTTAAIYKNKFAEDRAYLEQIKSSLAELENLTFSKAARREDENLGYLGTDPEGTQCRLIFFFRTGEWNYTTFAETSAQMTAETARQRRARYENWMEGLGLLPENAEFSLQNGDTLRWDVPPVEDIPAGVPAFQQGSVMIQFDDSGALANFFYQITWNEYAATETILSESQAYAQVEAGNFEQYVPFQAGDTLYISQCQLGYLYDTKGFYQPVYEFSGYINHRENYWGCRIPALSSFEASHKDDDGRNRQNGPADVPASNLPFGGLGLLCIANPEHQMPTEQLICKQNGNRCKRADEYPAKPACPFAFVGQFGASH